MHIAEHAAKI